MSGHGLPATRGTSQVRSIHLFRIVHQASSGLDRNLREVRLSAQAEPRPLGTPAHPHVRRLRSWRLSLAILGPGIMVMLADTDAGSVITAAQSGAQWGYRLLLLQVILVPILFMVQELTVRLGIVSRKGHAEMIRDHYGRGWAWVSVATLVLACIGALLSELSGLAGVGLLMGVPVWLTTALIVAVLIVMAYRGSYLTVERIAIAVGAFELVFLAVAWKAQPGLADLAAGAIDIAWRDPKYLYLVAANIGAVIMPWMVFYQQSDRKRTRLNS